MLAAIAGGTPSLAQQPTQATQRITEKQARESALKTIPNGKVIGDRLVHRKGKLVYAVDISLEHDVWEVWVDAYTGTVKHTAKKTPGEPSGHQTKKKKRHARKHRHRSA
jgi:hypothetical protein